MDLIYPQCFFTFQYFLLLLFFFGGGDFVALRIPLLNLFFVNVPFLCPLKTSVNLLFFYVFRGYGNGILVRKGLRFCLCSFPRTSLLLFFVSWNLASAEALIQGCSRKLLFWEVLQKFTKPPMESLFSKKLHNLNLLRSTLLGALLMEYCEIVRNEGSK